MKTLILAIVCCVVQTKFIHANDHYETIQVWNFLKYYHPDLASGKVNADSLFLLHIDNRNADLNQRIELFTKNLSNNFTQTTSSKANGDVLQKNQDFSWFEKSTVISKNNKQLISRIYENRYRGTNHHFVPTQGYETDLPNELAYNFEKQEQLPLNYRLLALARIIGAMDYLYPHKYLLSNDTEKNIKKAS